MFICIGMVLELQIWSEMSNWTDGVSFSRNVGLFCLCSLFALDSRATPPNSRTVRGRANTRPAVGAPYLERIVREYSKTGDARLFRNRLKSAPLSRRDQYDLAVAITPVLRQEALSDLVCRLGMASERSWNTDGEARPLAARPGPLGCAARKTTRPRGGFVGSRHLRSSLGAESDLATCFALRLLVQAAERAEQIGLPGIPYMKRAFYQKRSRPGALPDIPRAAWHAKLAPFDSYKQAWGDEARGSVRQMIHNCYNYAVGCLSSTRAQPGRAAGARYKSYKGDDLVAAARRDGLLRVDSSADLTSTDDARIVALFVGRKRAENGTEGEPSDHHWMVRHTDGTWSHKQGMCFPVNTDAQGRPITNPRTAAMRYQDAGTGSTNYYYKATFKVQKNTLVK